MADESNATLNDIAGLLRRQIEQADALATRGTAHRAQEGSLQVTLSRLLSLVLVTACLAWIFHMVDTRALATLENIKPIDLVEQQRHLHQHSYAWAFTALLILGGVYFALIDRIASLVRRVLPKG